MNREQRLREVVRRLREHQRTIFDLQGQAIVGLREALDAVGRTHEEMMGLFETTNTLDDFIVDEGDTSKQ